MIAFCYASGEIGIAEEVPKGAIGIAKGEPGRLKEFIETVSRHAWDGETYLVPGIPEAENQAKAYDALRKFTEWLLKGNRPGIEILGVQL